MMTVRQIERQWEAKAYDRLCSDLLTARPEATFRLRLDRIPSIPAAALALIRLDELSQSHVPLCSKLIKAILSAQEMDGGWGDLIVTTLCLRALLSGNGNGVAIERGLQYLANLQKSEGIWPVIPLRRTVADPYLSAVILYQLGDNSAFTRAVRIADAINWFIENENGLEPVTRAMWNRARLRARVPRSTRQATTTLLPGLS